MNLTFTTILLLLNLVGNELELLLKNTRNQQEFWASGLTLMVTANSLYNSVKMKLSELLTSLKESQLRNQMLFWKTPLFTTLGIFMKFKNNQRLLIFSFKLMTLDF